MSYLSGDVDFCTIQNHQLVVLWRGVDIFSELKEMAYHRHCRVKGALIYTKAKYVIFLGFGDHGWGWSVKRGGDVVWIICIPLGELIIVLVSALRDLDRNGCYGLSTTAERP